MATFLLFVFFGIPIAAVAFFAVSLYRYCAARKANKATPGSFAPEEMKRRKLLLIVSSVIAGALAFVVTGIVILLFTAVAFM